jgi:hypothetical protein
MPVPTSGLRGYVTATETYPLSNEESRVDIEIVSPEFLIIVEVKVDAPEGEEQCLDI